MAGGDEAVLRPPRYRSEHSNCDVRQDAKLNSLVEVTDRPIIVNRHMYEYDSTRMGYPVLCSRAEYDIHTSRAKEMISVLLAPQVSYHIYEVLALALWDCCLLVMPIVTHTTAQQQQQQRRQGSSTACSTEDTAISYVSGD